MTEKLSHKTIDHDEIRQWIEEHNGHPASVRDTGRKGGVGLLRVDFDYDGRDESLDQISWEEFFRAFEENNLAFIYQDHKKSGEDSTFFKFVDRDDVESDEPHREIDPQALKLLRQILDRQEQVLQMYMDAMDSISDGEVSELLADHADEQEYQVFMLENLVAGMGGQLK